MVDIHIGNPGSGTTSVQESSMLNLPPELLALIFEHFRYDFQTLCALCLAAHYLRPDAERLLYRNPFASVKSTFPTAARSPFSNSRQIQFLKSVSVANRLGQLVHTFICEPIVIDSEHTTYKLVKLALQEMVNLKCLVFRSFPGRPALGILQGCAFQLEALKWQTTGEDEHAFEKWLEGQKELRKLAVWLGTRRENKNSGSRAIPFGRSCCPRLEYLEGNRASIERLLPFRDITSLFWVPELGENVGRLQPMDHLADSLGNLRTLAYGAYYRRPPLSLIIEEVLALESLELVGLNADDDDIELEDVMKISTLKELVFCFSQSSRQVPLPREGRRRTVKKLFEKCPHLERVDVASEWVKIDEWVYERWQRGCDYPVKVQEDPVRSGRLRANWGESV